MSVEDLKMEPWEADGWYKEMGKARARGETRAQVVPMSRKQAEGFVKRVDVLLASCAFDANKNETAHLLHWARLLFWADQVRLADD